MINGWLVGFVLLVGWLGWLVGLVGWVGWLVGRLVGWLRLTQQLLYDPARDWLITGNEKLTVFPLRRHLRKGKEAMSHEESITTALYNHNFQQVCVLLLLLLLLLLWLLFAPHTQRLIYINNYK